MLVEILGLERCPPNNKIAKRFKHLMAQSETPVADVNLFRIADPPGYYLVCSDRFGLLPSMIFPRPPSASELRFLIDSVALEASTICLLRQSIAETPAKLPVPLPNEDRRCKCHSR